MQYKKDPELRYVDLCIFVDQNIPNIVDGQHPDIENTVYNYLWLLVKALAIKKHMFQKFEDYDGYAFYSASRLYFALRNNYLNQGKVIKGKHIKPIKSCLNYTKALLYPMKIEYQKETYQNIISEEFVSKKFDAFSYKEHLKDMAQASQGQSHIVQHYLEETIKSYDKVLSSILDKSPFSRKSSDYRRLKMSILLTCLNELNNSKTLNADPSSIILWKLPKSMASYAKILLQEFYTALKVEIMDCYTSTALDDSILEKLISTPDGEYKDNEK